MPKINTQTQHDQDIEGFIESLDPGTMRDASRLREIAAARAAVEADEERLRQAVAEARTAGDSWTMIGLALRTSKQNAFRKFGARAASE